MTMLYSLENFINSTTDLYSKTEDSLYVRENLYTERPSYPYRTTAVGSDVSPEWVCADLGSSKNVTLVSVFNHNIQYLPTVGGVFRLKGCNDACLGESGACDWAAEPVLVDLSVADRMIEHFRNTYGVLNSTFQCWLLEFADSTNGDGHIELGEWWLGQWSKFTTADCKVHLQPGRADGPQYFMGVQETHYGQDWHSYYSTTEHFSITLKNINDPDAVDEMHRFLTVVQRDYGGKFVFIPDDARPFCYYVIIKNIADYANRLIYGDKIELREWRLELKTLTEGIKLI